ncbi:hypothetical protein EDF64_11419 [Curtobacterium flaccumfaciens]|uniref:Uncharacterized protein n=1 Tax=Curtobacterium flaccumfaciens TaxID=2035 RepID=A0A4R6DC81_9MICO|nr:hypothetical protein [Curtobacterium flaccumfaciens]TDN41940.1 hypothetical protein EDF64_11419 [Curtobacterium flaccumfaciens]
MDWSGRSVRQQRDGWRSLARSRFDADVWSSAVAEALDDAIAAVIGVLNGVSLARLEDGAYYTGLVTSFLRTHLAVVDAARESELIDGTVLIRKQLEILARLHELGTAPASKLLGTTPNVKVLRLPLKTLYGSYSEIAHSSVTKHFELLGGSEYGDGWTSLYPKYSSNSKVLIQHAAIIFLDFWFWLRGFIEAQDVTVTELWAQSASAAGRLQHRLEDDIEPGPVSGIGA